MRGTELIVQKIVVQAAIRAVLRGAREVCLLFPLSLPTPTLTMEVRSSLSGTGEVIASGTRLLAAASHSSLINFVFAVCWALPSLASLVWCLSS